MAVGMIPLFRSRRLSCLLCEIDGFDVWAEVLPGGASTVCSDGADP